MKGVKLSLLGICLGITGLAFATNNVLAMGCALAGLAVSLGALFISK